MRTQIGNSTFEKNIFLFLPTTDMKNIFVDRNLSSDKNLLTEFIPIYSKLVSIIDKNPTIGTNIYLLNPSLAEKIQKKKEKSSKIIKINLLQTKKLTKSIDAIMETDDDGFICRSVDLPLYGYGDDPIESIENLKFEIESLYSDLLEDDNFSDEWLKYKSFLKQVIVEE